LFNKHSQSTVRASVLLNRLLARVRLRHLQAMVRLAELGNVHRAAQAMGLTQPAVTQLLADLERLIEAPLFVRHARGVAPTPLAQELLPLVRQMLHGLENSAELMATRRERAEGQVRALATVTGVNGLLAPCLPAFVQAHPQVQVLVTEIDVPALATLAGPAAADVVFCRQPALLPQGWTFEACRPDRFVVACGNRHPLAARATLAAADLDGATWLPNTVGSAARERFEALLAQQGWQAPGCQIVTRISTLTWTLLDAQPLLTLVPYGVVRPWVERGLLRVLPVPLELPFDPLGMLLPVGDPSPACARLVRFVRQHGAAQSPPEL
jgi:DNA-binding transcriptional LysR family regulator